MTTLMIQAGMTITNPSRASTCPHRCRRRGSGMTMAPGPTPDWRFVPIRRGPDEGILENRIKIRQNPRDVDPSGERGSDRVERPIRQRYTLVESSGIAQAEGSKPIR